jgi:hypothetical protein
VGNSTEHTWGFSASAINTERLTELVTDAWRMRAPRELAAEFDQLGS